MGFFKALGNFGKKVLGGAVNAGNWVRNMRDKVVSGINKAKDSLPGFLKAPIDAGIEFVMNSPVGRAAKMASGLLDKAVDTGQSVLGKMKDHEAKTGETPAEQLAAIGKRAAGEAPGQPEDSQQQARLEALAQN